MGEICEERTRFVRPHVKMSTLGEGVGGCIVLSPRTESDPRQDTSVCQDMVTGVWSRQFSHTWSSQWSSLQLTAAHHLASVCHVISSFLCWKRHRKLVLRAAPAGTHLVSESCQVPGAQYSRLHFSSCHCAPGCQAQAAHAGSDCSAALWVGSVCLRVGSLPSNWLFKTHQARESPFRSSLYPFSIPAPAAHSCVA